MAKRKHVDETAHLATANGLGRPKRVKLSNVANKENIQNPAPTTSKPIQKVEETTKTRVKPGPIPTTRTAHKSPRRRALQDKTENKTSLSNLRKQHPISKHITRSSIYNYEGWIEQQEVVFTSILNGIIGPGEWRKEDWDED